MKIFIICIVALWAINLIRTLFAGSENKSGNGVYYGNAAKTVSSSWVEYDRDNGEDAYINGY